MAIFTGYCWLAVDFYTNLFRSIVVNSYDLGLISFFSGQDIKNLILKAVISAFLIYFMNYLINFLYSNFHFFKWLLLYLKKKIILLATVGQQPLRFYQVLRVFLTFICFVFSILLTGRDYMFFFLIFYCFVQYDLPSQVNNSTTVTSCVEEIVFFCVAY